jgi:hypothetical protein
LGRRRSRQSHSNWYIDRGRSAAYILLAETRGSYAHHLRAIGHLREAEDESKEFPDLHATIRTARKAYQGEGAIPDWEALARAAEAIR